MNSDRPVDTGLSRSAQRLIARVFFGVHGSIAAVIAVVIVVFGPAPAAAPAETRFVLAGVVATYALLCALAIRLAAGPRFRSRAAMVACAVTAIGLTFVVAVLLGEGLRSGPLAFCGLVACGVAATLGPGRGIAVGAFGVAGLGAIGWAEANGRLAAAGAPGTALAYHLLLVVCGTVAGGLISRVLDNYLHKAAERELRFRSLLRIAADWYWEQDKNFRLNYISEVSGTTSGIARTERLGRTPWEIPDMGFTAEALEANRADLDAHRPFSNLRAQRRDAAGRWRSLSISGEPKFDAAGTFCGYWGVARDVTEELLAQRAVAATETRYRELFTRSPSPLFLHQRGLVFDANEAAARLFGFANAAAMNGLDILSLFPAGETRDRAVERLGQLDAMAVGEGLPVSDFRLRAIDGRPLAVQATVVRVDTASGPANLSIFFDISARKAAESALRRSEAMLSHLFATSPDCVTLTEASTGRYAMVNAAFTRLTGYATEEVVGRTALELGLWHDPADRARLLQLLGRDGEVVDMPAEFVTRSGERLSTLVSAGRFEMDHRDYLVLNTRDVTASERTRMQHAAILERASIGIAFVRGGTFVEANPYFERIFGWEPGSLAQQPCSVVWANDDDYREMDDLAGPVLAAGRPFETEWRLRRRDGSQFRCRMLAQAVDRSDPKGNGTIWIAEDVTERRRLDEALAAARDAAEAASRAKSAFLANTSHEIRTPLNGLLGLARLAMRADLPEARRQAYLAQILDSAQALAGIMSDILDVSKIEAGKLALDEAPFDLRDLLRAVHHAYESLAHGKGLALVLALEERVPTHVCGDPVRVRQILANFITNALKFTERGEVRIEAATAPGGGVRLAVADTGPGIAGELQTRLFMPFSQGDSSTTRRFGGTGLGLSICRELAQLMGGRVGVESRPGEGSTFWAELPLYDAAAPRRPSSTEATDLARLRGARVLLAEDNPVNMMIAVAMLEHWAVEVTQVADGRAAVEAVDAAVAAHHPFDVVVMDVQMPVMGGHEAARELRRRYDAVALPILALTAAALVSERDEALAAGMDAFLTKPIEAGRLRHALAGLMRRDVAAAGL
jgi:PAS domain S-box-containing protein